MVYVDQTPSLPLCCAPHSCSDVPVHHKVWTLARSISELEREKVLPGYPVHVYTEFKVPCHCSTNPLFSYKARTEGAVDFALHTKEGGAPILIGKAEKNN